MNKFFNTADAEGFKRSPPPSYFYLDWTQRKAEWRTISNAPNQKNIKFSSVVRWKELKNLNVNICTNYAESKSDSNFGGIDNPYTNVSYLKSHLQKSVRRSDVWRTIKTSYHMMLLDLQSFLRRLCIIALEDALPLEGFNVLVWFTSAVSKGYNMSDSQKCWCLGYAMKLAECPHYEIHEHSDKEFDLTKNKLYRLDQKQSDLLYSIQFRKAYGGMRGDKWMLSSLAEKWHNRFVEDPEKWWLTLKAHIPFVLPPEEPLEIGEWILAAIDFHCCPGILNNLSMTYDGYTEEEMKSAIWHYSSSITNKIAIDGREPTLIDPTLEPIWSTISKKFNGMARFLLKVSL